MGQEHSVLALVTIVVLYGGIGIMAAKGTIGVFHKILRPKSEQFFYAIVLIPIAALYLAFVAYFDAATAWRLEIAVVLTFVVIALLGIRLPVALIIGYSLHGVWDLLHELQAHGAWSAFEPGQLSAIPLAYGVFCSVYDFYMAGYFYKQRAEWSAAWKVVTPSA
jgi:hypothetical protein